MMNVAVGYGEVTLAVVLIAVLQFLLMTWLRTWIENSVKSAYDERLTEYKHELDKRLEEYRNEFKVREQAAKVAELLSHIRWNEEQGAGEKFDRLAWELSLWLPSEVVMKLTNCLVREGG